MDVLVSSTEVARLSLMPPTSSMEDAISLMEEEVSSAATVSSSLLRETFFIDCPISSIAAAFSAMLVAKSSVSRLTDFGESGHFFHGRSGFSGRKWPFPAPTQ